MNKVILYLTIIITLFSCNSKQKSEIVKVNSNSELDNFGEFAQKATPNNTTPSNITVFFRSTGAPYMSKLVNSPANYLKYEGINELAAVNIGIYWVDALYQYSYNHNKEALSSAKAAVSLARTLGIGDVFKELLVEKYTENQNTDSFFIKLDECFMNAEYILSERARMRIYTSMLIGKYIQSQYILFTLIFDYPKDVPEDVKLVLLSDLLVSVNKNLKSVYVLLSLINTYEKSEDAGKLHKKIKSFADNYHSLDFYKSSSTITPEMIFDNNTLKVMYGQIKDMREYVIKVNN